MANGMGQVPTMSEFARDVLPDLVAAVGLQAVSNSSGVAIETVHAAVVGGEFITTILAYTQDDHVVIVRS